MLRQDFGVEHIDVILGHNVEYVHRVNVKAAHFGARVPKRRSPGEGGMRKGLVI